jgi:cyclopropane-fatty-acyl-phospholipid synthase
MEKLFESFMRTLIRRGSIAVETPSGRTFEAGDGTGPSLGIRVRDPQSEARLVRDPELAFGELYMNGAIEVTQGTLLDVMQLGLSNLAQEGEARWLRLLRQTRIALRRLQQRNDLLRSRDNVAHHYDLDGHLYDLFLDADRQYSCAYFERPGATLEEAQRAKKRHIAAKLLVEPGQRVLDIGCGWGGMALYLAEICDAHVTGITLSHEQWSEAGRRADASPRGRDLEFRLQDYRDVNGRFDRIVSVGMFEHVGVSYYDIYFRKIASLLAEDGVALVHTIGRPDTPGATNPWIAKYVFPGGYIPALSEIMPAIERAGLLVTDIEILRLHYADTLKDWRERFLAHREEVARLYDDRFCRMWEFYLAGSEAGFRLGQQIVFQIQLARRVDAVPITRDYIAENEKRLREREGGTQQVMAST